MKTLISNQELIELTLAPKGDDKDLRALKNQCYMYELANKKNLH